MEKEYLRVGEEYKRIKERAEKKSLFGGNLCQSLWNVVDNYYNSEAFAALWSQLCRVYGKQPTQLKTPEEFWNPTLKKAVVRLVGKERQADMEEMTRMQMSCQFSASMCRRSYRSKDFGYHAAAVVRKVCDWIYWTAYEKTVEEMLFYEHDYVRGYDMYLALELRRENRKVVSLVREAMLGDNGNILLSHTMLRAVVISGHRKLLDLMKKLLLAARLQEGLRQQILEQADAGSVETFTEFLRLCVEEDLFRYSSAVRALDVWTGLGYDNEKPAMVKKYAALALSCLENPKVRKEYLTSENNLEAYFAIWAMASHETADCDSYVQTLLTDSQKYRRVLGWYFISHSDSPQFQMQTAVRYLEERDKELLAWVVNNLAVTGEALYCYRWNREKPKPVMNPALPDTLSERRALFSRLKDAAEYIGAGNHTYTGNPFPFSSVALENTRVIGCMMSLAFYDFDDRLILELAPYRSFMNVDQRHAYYANYLKPGQQDSHRKLLREALNDRSVSVKETAVEALSSCNLLEEDLEALADSLRSKSSQLRKSVLAIFKKQPEEKLAPVVGRMIKSPEEYQVQAAIELLLELGGQYPGLLEGQQENLKELSERKLSSQTEILLKQLQPGDGVDEGKEAWTEKNGFGLYDPEYVKNLMDGKLLTEAFGLQAGADGDATGEGECDLLYTEKELRERLLLSRQEFDGLMERMNAVFERHADYEYEVRCYDGSRSKVLFGSLSGSAIPLPAECEGSGQEGRKLTMIPFYEEFTEAAGAFATDVKEYLRLYYSVVPWSSSGFYFVRDLEYQKWIQPLIDKGFENMLSDYDTYKQRDWQIKDVFRLLAGCFDTHTLFACGLPLYRSMAALVPDGALGRNCLQQKTGSRVYYGSGTERAAINLRMLGSLRELLAANAVSTEDFTVWFVTEHQLECAAGVGVYGGLTIEEYFRACDMGIVRRDVLYRKLLEPAGYHNITMLTNPARYVRGRKLLETYPWAKEVVNAAVERIVEVEEQRGELTTEVTHVARAIQRFEGAGHFARLLAALGKENFFRGYEYSGDTTKRAVLSGLLKRCYPAKSDTPGILKEEMEKTDIKDKRLAEAVMYAPQWAGFAEEILGWPGLSCGVWFFHAHVNESFSAEKETCVALYSPITPQQFNDGAFDKDWFFEAYGQLGEKRFQVLYKSAKYITSGSNQHRRSQLYTDAVLGRLDSESLKAEIIEKRNQEKLRCYPLIPIPEGQPKEVLGRYEFLQKFLKESRQFGAQRRESEGKAVAIAMENLAMTAGFSDVNRMTWYLESEKLKELEPLMEPQEMEGVTFFLEIDGDGTPGLAIKKGDKRIKTLPKSLQKQEEVLNIKAAVKDLKEQKSRARQSLERAMVDRISFGAEELVRISANPVLSPMLFSLVWVLKDEEEIPEAAAAGDIEKSGLVCGFLEMSKQGLILRGADGKSFLLSDGDRPGERTLRIAHPYDLQQAGLWAAYMHELYQSKRIQPFKQVFREYYPLTEDERQEKNISRRYAGYQVQPQKTAALLKGRGWTVDYEEGLQKVCYRENIIVRMYALADWFSPADIEAPTLEVIRFYDRKTGDLMDLEAVSPVLFSEAMRDMDLAVSVAHAGGVDPEASHSTVEMRAAIARELTALLGLSNVTYTGSHARIQGKLGTYSVHLGSGVVHAEAVGMLSILPVHSQARGRIFLPFADDDPKTAEIMSKIILLAEDGKIKDTGILRQIQGQ